MIRRQALSRRLGLRILARVRSSQTEIKARNSLGDKVREVFRGRDRFLNDHIIFAQRRLERAPEPLRQRGIVIHRVGALITFDQRLARRSGRGCLRPYNSRNGSQHLLSHFRLIGAHRQSEFSLVRNDVVLGPGMDVSDRHHGHLARLHFAGSNGLQP